MEELQIHKEKEKNLIELFVKRGSMWIPLFLIGLISVVPAIIASFTVFTISSSPSAVVFYAIGIAFWAQSREAAKKVENGDYKAYTVKCRKVSPLFGYVWVENNEVLSKKVKKPKKRLEFIGAAKSFQVDEEIGIIRIGKDFWAFSLRA